MSRFISDTLRQRVRETAKQRCGYCLTQEAVIGMPLEVDHIIPVSCNGSSAEENLWLACRMCNRYKSNHIEGFDEVTSQQVALFNPRTQQWKEHFDWSNNGMYLNDRTPIGRVTITVLQLNNPFVVRSRQTWVEWGWHPPVD